MDWITKQLSKITGKARESGVKDLPTKKSSRNDKQRLARKTKRKHAKLARRRNRKK